MSGTRIIWIFLAVTFGWTWLFWVPGALHWSGAISLPAGVVAFLDSPYNPAAWGPLLGAIVVSFLEGGVPGVGRLLRRGVEFRFGWVWYVAVVATFPVLIGGALLLALAFGEPVPELPAFAEPASIPFAFVFILLLSGPIQEEFGWRGILQDRLQERNGAALSALGVGVIWGLWHLPLFFTSTQDLYYQRPIWGLVLSTTLISVLFAWIFNNVGKSIAAMILFHTMYNFTHFLIPTLQSDLAALILFGLQFAAVIAVVVLWGPATLARERAQTTPPPPPEARRE